jgi:hypothetical protein
MLIYDASDGTIGDLSIYSNNSAIGWPPAYGASDVFSSTASSVSGGSVNLSPSLSGSYTATASMDSYFMLVSSGVAKGRLYPISSGGANSITISGVDLTSHGMEAGDDITVIGPGFVGLEEQVEDQGVTLYSWGAVICGEDPSVAGFHQAYVFAFDRSVGTDFDKIKESEPACYLVTGLAE